MCRSLSASLAAALLWTCLSACGPTAIGQGPAGPAQPGEEQGTKARPTEPEVTRPALPREWVEAICDRVEDCAVERNAALAKESGGNDQDVGAAMADAREALVSGSVRSFCLLRTRKLGRPDAERIHGCLGTNKGCADFYRCADFPGSESRARPAAPQARAVH